VTSAASDNVSTGYISGGTNAEAGKSLLRVSQQGGNREESLYGLSRTPAANPGRVGRGGVALGDPEAPQSLEGTVAANTTSRPNRGRRTDEAAVRELAAFSCLTSKRAAHPAENRAERAASNHLCEVGAVAAAVVESPVNDSAPKDARVTPCQGTRSDHPIVGSSQARERGTAVGNGGRPRCHHHYLAPSRDGTCETRLRRLLLCCVSATLSDPRAGEVHSTPSPSRPRGGTGD